MEECFDVYYSHPPNSDSYPQGNKLKSHLESVGKIAKKETPPQEIDNVELDRIAEVAGLIHDFGKYTTYFQEYIRNENNTGSNLTNHSRLSSIIAFYVADYLDWTLNEIAILTTTIRKHHGNLDTELTKLFKNIVPRNPETNPRDEKNKKNLIKQIESLKKSDEARELLQSLTRDNSSSFEELKQIVKDGVITNPTERFDPKPESYSYVLQVWGSLIIADKIDAANIDPDLLTQNEKLDPTKIDAHIQNLTSLHDIGQAHKDELDKNDYSNMDILREYARYQSKTHAQKNESNKYTLSLPTGFGKTFTGLSSAFELAKEKKGESRIIYALPFTSIIDQTDSVIQDVFDITPVSPEYTVHHYLSETRSKVGENNVHELDYNEQVKLAKSWRSQLILTTFVQLYESISGPKNNKGLKTSALQDSIIILDEPQALPHDWWQLIQRLTDMLSEKYNATIISMTATQPNLLDDDQPELLPSTEPYVNYLQQNPRVEFIKHSSLLNYEKIGPESNGLKHNKAANEISQKEDKQVLAICNTIRSSEQLYENLEEMNDYTILNKKIKSLPPTKNSYETLKDEIEEPIICHLSTRIRPKDRKKLLEVADLITQTNKTIHIVSTQLVEAGVDISFEEIYRDFAPIPNIVQAAGRCNRENNSEIGKVNIWRLENPNEDFDTTPSAQIYAQDANLLQPSRKALEKHEKTVEEATMISETIETYYELMPDNIGNGYDKFVDSANMKKLSQVSLITNDYQNISIYIPNEGSEKEKMEQLPTMNYEDKNKILKEIEELSVTIPVPYEGGEILQRNLNQIQVGNRIIHYISVNSDYYNLETGVDADALNSKSVSNRLM